jgi:hypothetical protein
MASRIAAIDHVPVERVRRKYLTKGQKLERHAAFYGRCGNCWVEVPVSGPGVHWDHRNPLGLTGTNDLENWQPLCDDCDAEKTPNDWKSIAKSNRLIKKNAPPETRALAKPKGRKLQSRPFQRKAKP